METFKTILCEVLPGSRPSASRFAPITLEGEWKGRITDVKVLTKNKGSFVLHVGLLRQRITLSVNQGGETILSIADNDTWASVPSGVLYEVQHVIESDDVEVLSLSFVLVLSSGDVGGDLDLSPLFT
jgi:hypothetical protein